MPTKRPKRWMGGEPNLGSRWTDKEGNGSTIADNGLIFPDEKPIEFPEERQPAEEDAGWSLDSLVEGLATPEQEQGMGGGIRKAIEALQFNNLWDDED